MGDMTRLRLTDGARPDVDDRGSMLAHAAGFVVGDRL
jgi:hypothetical protein